MLLILLNKCPKRTHLTEEPINSALSHLAGGHEEGEGEDEGALGNGKPVGLLQGEEDGAVQTGFGRATRRERSRSTSEVLIKHLRVNSCLLLI